MKIAVIGDIHGYYPALVQAHKAIQAEGCAKVYCIGDLIDGYNMDNETVEYIRDSEIISIKGNHDELPLNWLKSDVSDWLNNLPDTMSDFGINFFHQSPRMIDESIQNEHNAWNVFDDTKFNTSIIGHSHYAGIYRFKNEKGASVEIVKITDREIELDKSYRHLIVNPSLSYNRVGTNKPGYSIINLDKLAVKFKYLDMSPIVQY